MKGNEAFKVLCQADWCGGGGKGGLWDIGSRLWDVFEQGLGWECDIPRLSPGVRVLLQHFQLRAPCPINAILSQVLLGSSVIFMWKFWAEMAEGCRMEGSPAAHPQEELEVSFSIPSCQGVPPRQKLRTVRAGGSFKSPVLKVSFIMHCTACSHPSAAMPVHSQNWICDSWIQGGGVGSLCGLPNNRERQENQHITRCLLAVRLI